METLFNAGFVDLVNLAVPIGFGIAWGAVMFAGFLMAIFIGLMGVAFVVGQPIVWAFRLWRRLSSR